MRSCSGCGTENPDNARYCFSCGGNIGVVDCCPECTEPLPSGNVRFCPACGTRLKADRESDQSLKLVTVLFADVVGSTSRAEQMYPDEVRELMADFFNAMAQEIRNEGGRVEKLIGDAIMAVFGVPRSHEDDPLRATGAARAMLARLERWNEGRPDLHKVFIRIGVNTGNVFVGSTLIQEFMITGDAVNVAARLESAAAPMSVVVGERTARSIRDRYALQALEPLTLKGKSEPVPAYSVVGEIGSDSAVTRISAPLVGRDDELGRLREALRRAEAEGRPRTITISADPGTGKSRLVEEFAEGVGSGTRVLTGRCIPYGEGVTLWPLAEILRTEAAIAHNDPPLEAFDKIMKLVRSSIPSEDLPTPERTAAALAMTIGLTDVLNPVKQVDPRERFGELLGAWEALLGGLSDGNPLILLIEDLHWADPTMFEVLSHLSDRVDGPVLFLCTTRPELFEAHPEWSKLSRSSVISLPPLSDKDVELLVWYLLGMVRLPVEIRQTLLSKSEGNPFYLEEMLRHLIDEGYLSNRSGTWEFSGDLSELRIPDTVQGVLQARLDLLSPPVKQVAQSAAVVGRTFWSGALTEMDPVVVHAALNELERKELIVRSRSSSMVGETEYTFAHMLVRDVAYESLPRKRRAQAHHATGNWIRRISGERFDEVSEMVAFHLDKAYGYSKSEHLRGEARDLYAVAARFACRNFAMRQAETHGRRVVELSVSPVERVEALETLGDLFSLSMSVDEAWAAYLQAISERRSVELEQASDAVVARLAAKAAIAPTRWSGALKDPIPEEGIRAVIDLGLANIDEDEEPQRALLLAARAILQADSSDADAGEEDARIALDIARRSGDADLISAAIDAMNNWLLPKSLYGEIYRINQERLKLISNLSSVGEICDAYGVAGWSAGFVGRYQDAERYATAYLERARGVDPGNYLLGLVDRAQARLMTGEWDGALADVAEVERINEADPQDELPPPHTWLAYAVALLIHQIRGNTDRAAVYEQWLRSFALTEIGQKEGPTMRNAIWARALARRGAVNEARSMLSMEPSAVTGVHLETLCDVLTYATDLKGAGDVIDAALAEAERADLVALPLFADRLKGLLLARSGSPEAGAAALKNSAQGFRSLGAPYEEALSLLHLARVLRRTDQQHQAMGYADSALQRFAHVNAIREKQAAARVIEELCGLIPDENTDQDVSPTQ